MSLIYVLVNNALIIETELTNVYANWIPGFIIARYWKPISNELLTKLLIDPLKISCVNCVIDPKDIPVVKLVTALAILSTLKSPPDTTLVIALTISLLQTVCDC